MRSAIVQAMEKLPDFIAVYDRRYVRPPMEIGKKIENLISSCDCVIALLTKDGLKSEYVRKELDIAHAKRLITIPIVATPVVADDLPPYLRGIAWIPHDDRHIDEVINEMLDALIRVRSNSTSYAATVQSQIQSGECVIIQDGTDDSKCSLLHTICSDDKGAWIRCTLRLREVERNISVLIRTTTEVGAIARSCIQQVLPELLEKDYEWTLEHKGTILPSYYTPAAAGIENGSTVFLIGTRGVIRPAG